MTSNLKQSWDR